MKNNDMLVKLDEKEVLKIIEENMIIESYPHRPYEGYKTVNSRLLAKAICEKFGRGHESQ